MLTNAQMQAVIDAGGSVLYKGEQIKVKGNLPTDVQIAADVAEATSKNPDLPLDRTWRKAPLTNAQMLAITGRPARAGLNEIQTITTGAGNTGGTFTITFSGQTTSAIAFDASASDAQTALEALSNIGVGDVSVTRTGTTGAGLVFTVTFTGALADQNLPAMTTTPSLTGGANTATVATVQNGLAAVTAITGSGGSVMFGDNKITSAGSLPSDAEITAYELARWNAVS